MINLLPIFHCFLTAQPYETVILCLLIIFLIPDSSYLPFDLLDISTFHLAFGTPAASFFLYSSFPFLSSMGD